MNGFSSPEHLAKTPGLDGLVGAGVDEGAEDDSTEMYGVRPMTVGLVERGANRKAFFLAKSDVSKTPWGSIDKTALGQKVARLYAAGKLTARDVREVYADVPAEAFTRVDGKAVFLPSRASYPHHEVRGDGTVVLNVGGLHAALAAARGARSGKAAGSSVITHLMRHYRAIGEEPKSISKAEGGNMNGPNDLDSVLTVIEQAASDMSDEEIMDEVDKAVKPMMDEDAEEAAESQSAAEEDGSKKKRKQGFMNDLIKALVGLAARNERDPVKAAQSALSTIAEHPELQEVARELMAFIDAAGKKEPQDGQGTETPAAPAKPKAPTPPPSEAGLSEQGQFSVAEKAVVPGQGATAPGATPKKDKEEAMDQQQLAAAITTAIEPLTKQLAEITQANAELQKSVIAMQVQSEEAKMTPLAKSMGISAADLLAMKGAMSEQAFTAVLQQTQRYQRLAKSAGMFDEIGTAAGGAAEDMDPEVLLQKKATELMQSKKISLGDAVVEASMQLGLDLNRAPSLGEGE